MILVDTSVWVDHLRGKATPLDLLLNAAPVLLHPFVLGELLLHGLPREGPVRQTMSRLMSAPVASPDEVVAFIGWARLASTGIGYVDTHLLVSARMVASGQLLTRDRKLLAQAERLQIAYS